MKMILKAIAMVMLIAGAGCDKFFSVEAVVTDAATSQPVSDAHATLVLDKGVDEPTSVKTSAADGTLKMLMNEPASAWATLTVEKPGYHPWSAQFKGRPCPGLVIRLIPEKEK
jgi:hypothetical protein